MLKNKIVLITGASSGIGAASAKKFASVGAKLILCARRVDLLEQLASDIYEQYATPTYLFELDVTKPQDVKQAIANLKSEWQPIDILINNAGLALGLASFQEGDEADWDVMIDTNVKGLLSVTKAVLPQMIANNKGHIVNICSVAGHIVYPKGAVYCATKHAVKAISSGLRMDLFGTKIRVTSISPGAVETNFSRVRFKGNEAKAKAVYEGMEPLQAEDVADAILYCTTCPPHVNVSEMILMPTDQASATMIARHKE